MDTSLPRQDCDAGDHVTAEINADGGASHIQRDLVEDKTRIIKESDFKLIERAREDVMAANDFKKKARHVAVSRVDTKGKLIVQNEIDHFLESIGQIMHAEQTAKHKVEIE